MSSLALSHVTNTNYIYNFFIKHFITIGANFLSKVYILILISSILNKN